MSRRIPPGLTISTTNNPTPPITITGEEKFLDNDFGYMNAGPGVAIIGDYVWSDANNNGIQDSGEIGLGGVTMQLVTSPGGVARCNDDHQCVWNLSYSPM